MKSQTRKVSLIERGTGTSAPGEPRQDPIALLTRAVGAMARDIRTANPLAISEAVFLTHVHAIAAQLPSHPYLLLQLQNRYLFLVCFCAAQLNRQTCLVPQYSASAELDRVTRLFDAEIVSDDQIQIDWNAQQQQDVVIPEIDLDHTALICFTSGSTGDPKPIEKSWQTVRSSSFINRRYMCADQGRSLVYHYAGVPQQHMWGLETSIFLPLFSQVCMVDAYADLPGDILRQLKQLPAPLCFIGTPLHLRALAKLGQESATSVSQFLSATSPLDTSVAKEIESLYSSAVKEVYGCSEIGSMAIKHTAHSDVWLRFDGIDFALSSDGKTTASCEHIKEPVVLNDHIELLEDRHFKLAGRQGDLVKIAGKRGSLQQINQILLRYPHLTDGIVFMPDEQKGIARLAAIVSLSSGDKKQLRNYLKEHLDSAFVPRPIYVVDTLPRQANGKLPQKLVDDLYRSLQKSSR